MGPRMSIRFREEQISEELGHLGGGLALQPVTLCSPAVRPLWLPFLLSLMEDAADTLACLLF